MGFKENLRQKIEIDRLAGHVVRTVTAGPDSNVRLDKPAMRRLLDTAGWQPRHERDLELYLPPAEADGEVLVLDNDLPLYRTSVADVALRKSPTVKEMVNIRNIVRILNDADVVVSKKAETVETFRRACIGRLDLNYTAADIEALAFDGRAALENRYPEGIVEVIDLFAELLGFQTPPKAFGAPHHHIRGHRPPGGALARFGPLVLYDRIHHRLQWIDTPLDAADPDQLQRYQQILQTAAPAPLEGPAVFQRLADQVPPASAAPSE